MSWCFYNFVALEWATARRQAEAICNTQACFYPFVSTIPDDINCHINQSSQRHFDPPCK